MHVAMRGAFRYNTSVTKKWLKTKYSGVALRQLAEVEQVAYVYSLCYLQ